MKKVLFWIFIAFIAIQFIPVNRENPPINPDNNFVTIYKTPKDIELILKKACYDCHSNETIYPSYSNFAPISWMIKDHVNEGRRYLNFSDWANQTEEVKANALEKSILTIDNYQMPLPSYISKHPEANLTRKERDILIIYFNHLLSQKK